MSLFKNSRFYTLMFSFSLSVCVYLFITIKTPYEIPQTIQLNKTYGLISFLYLYIVLLIGPVCYTFKKIPRSVASVLTHMRRALGVSVFYFALLHSCIAFFNQLVGFEGLPFLSNTYLFSLGIGFIGLIILFFLTITSLDYAIRLMQFKKWKLLHRLIYIGGFLILFHAYVLGSDFSHFTSPISQITTVLLFFLLLLEARRFDFYIKKKTRGIPVVTIGICLIFSLLVLLAFIPQTIIPSLNIHANHIRIN